MDDKQALEMMERCAAEIRQRDEYIKNTAPKLQAHDRLCQVLDLAFANRGGAMSADCDADILYTLRRESEKLREALAKEKAEVQQPSNTA